MLDVRKKFFRFAGPFAQGHDAKNMAARKAKAGSCPCCVKATHIAVSARFKLGACSQLEDLGLHRWAREGPWADRRLVAGSAVLGNYGCPLPAGRDWAARSPEFVAPRHLIRLSCRGAPVLISTIAGSKELQKRRDKSKGAEINLQNTQETVK